MKYCFNQNLDCIHKKVVQRTIQCEDLRATFCCRSDFAVSENMKGIFSPGWTQQNIMDPVVKYILPWSMVESKDFDAILKNKVMFIFNYISKCRKRELDTQLSVVMILQVAHWAIPCRGSYLWPGMYVYSAVRAYCHFLEHKICWVNKWTDE